MYEKSFPFSAGSIQNIPSGFRIFGKTKHARMAIVNSVISWFIKKRVHQIELFRKYPHEVQNDLLRKLVGAAEATEWGQRWQYQAIREYEDFRKRVPVNDYDGLKPYIDRIRNGEQNLLWNTEIKLYAKSSGTTSDKSKFIPVSFESLEDCHYKAGKDMLSIYCNNYPETNLFDGKNLAMGGSQSIREVNNSQYMDGDLSAILLQNLPFWAEIRRTPQLSVALMEEWEQKIEKMAVLTARDNVTSIAGVPSWTLLLMRKILENTGKRNICEVWPNLEVFFHGGVNFQPYRKQFNDIMPCDSMRYMETYNASEGFFGLQDDPSNDDMLLMLDYGIFYEFVPFEQLHRAQEAALPIWEVETGRNYAMVISTNGGLWRYMIGDTVIFTSTNPYKIKITGRTRHFINAFGEEVIAGNAEQAFAIACEKCHAVITEYTGAPVYFSEGRSGAHQWVVEFEQPPESLEYFTEMFDNALKSINSDYEAKRYHNMILGMPEIVPVPAGTFYQWMKSRNKLGGQHKVPRLANERTYIEDILKMTDHSQTVNQPTVWT